MTSHKLTMLQQQLAAAMTEQQAAEQALADVLSTVEAEFAPVFQRARQAKADSKALEEIARLEIESYYAVTGDSPELVGFGIQQRTGIQYDADELLVWAVEHNHELLALKESAVKDFLAECQTAVDADTGEKVWLYFGTPVPASITLKPTAEIQRKALLSWLDEQRFKAERAMQEA